MRVIWVLAAVLIVTTLAFADSPTTLPDSVAARVNGEDISLAALDVFVKAARRHDKEANRRSVLKGLLESHLLATMNTTKSVIDNHNTVGYDYHTQVEQQLFKLIRSAYQTPLEKTMQSANVNSSLDFLTAPLTLNINKLKPILQLQQKLYSSMTTDQRNSAEQLVIARYKFRNTQAEQVLTLWDLYRRQNIQLKVQMHSLNLEFIREAIKQQLTSAYVLDWFEISSSLDQVSRATVKQCIEYALQRELLLQNMGLIHDIHDENPHLQALAKSVTKKEVHHYYKKHKENFKRIEKVHAYHIRLESQEKADLVYKEIKAGLPFHKAIQKYSNATDRNSNGSLGWIDRENHRDHWTLAMAFSLPENTVSKPFRSPQKAGDVHWEILWIDKRKISYQPIESDSVHYRATNAIAQKKLQEKFYTLISLAKKNASIQLNQRLLSCESC